MEFDYIAELKKDHKDFDRLYRWCLNNYKVKVSAIDFEEGNILFESKQIRKYGHILPKRMRLPLSAVTLKQFIGLADKYGIRIYDGSKVSAITNDGKDSIEGTVVYHEFEWCVEQDDDKFPLCSFTVIDLASIKILEV